MKLKGSKSLFYFSVNEHASSHKFYIPDEYFTANGYSFDELMNKSEADYRPVLPCLFLFQDHLNLLPDLSFP